MYILKSPIPCSQKQFQSASYIDISISRPVLIIGGLQSSTRCQEEGQDDSIRLYHRTSFNFLLYRYKEKSCASLLSSMCSLRFLSTNLLPVLYIMSVTKFPFYVLGVLF